MMKRTFLSVMMMVLALSANAVVFDDTSSATALTPAADMDFERNEGQYVLFLHETGFAGNYSSVAADIWLPTGTSVSAVTFNLGARTGGIDAAWFTSPPTWQSTVSGLTGTFTGVLETAGSWERRTVAINATGLSFTAGDSALGISFAGISTAVWATARPEDVNPNFVSDGLGGPNGLQSENFLKGKVEAVPEPATLAALGLGVITLLRRRKA